MCPGLRLNTAHYDGCHVAVTCLVLHNGRHWASAVFCLFCDTCTKRSKGSSVETWMKERLGGPTPIETDPTRSGWQGMEWINVTLDRDWWRALVCDVVTHSVSRSWGNSRRTAVLCWVAWLMGCLGRYGIARRTNTVVCQIYCLLLSLSVPCPDFGIVIWKPFRGNFPKSSHTRISAH